MNKKLLAGSLLVASLIGGGTQLAGADTADVTVVAGSRSASATALHLPSVESNSFDKWTVGTVTVTSTSNNSSTAWTTTIQAGNFAGPNHDIDTNGDGQADATVADSIPAANLEVQYIDPITTVSSNGGVNPDYGNAATWTMDQALPIMTAPAGAAVGTWSTNVGLLLHVPANKTPGTYSTALTVSITAAP